jgi:hypothetical protein
MSEQRDPPRDTLTVVGQLSVTPQSLEPLFTAARSVDDLAPILSNDGNFLATLLKEHERYLAGLPPADIRV